MIYLFEDPRGNVVERFFSMSEAPEIGSMVADPDHPDEEIRRLPSSCTRPIKLEYSHVAHSLPRVHDPRRVAALREAEAAREPDPEKRQELRKSADEWRRSEPVWKHTTPDGKPVFTSKAQVQEFQARTGHRMGWGED